MNKDQIPRHWWNIVLHNNAVIEFPDDITLLLLVDSTFKGHGRDQQRGKEKREEIWKREKKGELESCRNGDNDGRIGIEADSDGDIDRGYFAEVIPTNSRHASVYIEHMCCCPWSAEG